MISCIMPKISYSFLDWPLGASTVKEQSLTGQLWNPSGGVHENRFNHIFWAHDSSKRLSLSFFVQMWLNHFFWNTSKFPDICSNSCLCNAVDSNIFMNEIACKCLRKVIHGSFGRFKIDPHRYNFDGSSGGLLQSLTLCYITYVAYI